MADTCNSQSVFFILIVGCGLSGLASALALAQAGHRVIVFERSAQLQEVVSFFPQRKSFELFLKEPIRSVLEYSYPPMQRVCFRVGACSTRY